MIIKRNNFKIIKKQNFSIAVGNFDGIHKGHKYLLDALLKYKKNDNSKVAVLSFTPHPIKIMAPNNWKKNLVRFRTKYEKLKLLGLDALFLLSFSKKFSETSAEQFIVKYLINMLNVKNIVVGEDFRFGYNREGNVNLLKKYQEKGAFNIEAVKKKSDNKNNIYSSSLIRDLVKTLVNTILENIVEKIPIESVTANPLIGPSPRRNMQIDAIRVVKLASSIVDRDFSKPASILAAFSFPLESSSLILS